MRHKWPGELQQRQELSAHIPAHRLSCSAAVLAHVSSKGVNQAVSEMHTGPQDQNNANGKWQPALLQLQLQNPYGNLAKMKLSSPTRLCNCGKLSLSAQKSKWTWQQICFLVTTGTRYMSSAFFFTGTVLSRSSLLLKLWPLSTLLLAKNSPHKTPTTLSSI